MLPSHAVSFTYIFKEVVSEMFGIFYICQCIGIFNQYCCHAILPWRYTVPFVVRRSPCSNGHFAAQEEQRPLSEFLHSYESDHLSHKKSQIRGNNQATGHEVVGEKKSNNKARCRIQAGKYVEHKVRPSCRFFQVWTGKWKTWNSADSLRIVWCKDVSLSAI